jgi:hypothetical protein
MGNTKSVTGGTNNLCGTLPYSYIFSGSYVVNRIFYFERKGRQHYFVFVPSVLIILSIGHLVVAGIKWYSSNEPHKQPTTQAQNCTNSRKHITKTKKLTQSSHI